MILDAIRNKDRVARIDVAKITGISQATVTTITAEMLKQGLIQEVSGDDAPAGGQRRGRPRVDLAIRGDAHIVAGIKVNDTGVSVALVDFAGALIGEHSAPLPAPVMNPQDLCDNLKTAVAEAAKSVNLTPADISAVGIALAGTVDAENGIVHWSPLLTDRNVALQKMAAHTLGLPTYVDNDANLVAMAEMLFGHGVDAKDFIVVTIEAGVGMGIVLNRALYRGTRGCGAEFGHTKVQLDGALCRCGQRGCLEAYVADYALLREASVPGTLHDQTEPTIATLLQAAKDDDPKAQTIVNRAARMFAMGLANIVNIFDPELIILAGAQMQFDHLYADAVIDAIRDQIVQVDMPPPEIVVHKWGDLMWAKGAAAYAIDCVADTALREIGDTAA